jgi:preprotein translocase subunit SecA
MSVNPLKIPQKFVRSIFGSRNDRLLKKLGKAVTSINDLEAEYADLSDDQLVQKTTEFRARIADGASLDSLMSEAFAVVREAGKRILDMRHFDVQMMGGMVLHQGKIAEMRTGEGKTLVATLATYLNALSGRGVHVITVNDYLANRDSQWMGKLYSFLGLSVGVVLSGMNPNERKDAYAADITYGTNNEFGFDYLRDNMAFSADQRVQRELVYAVVDEVDSILIDEARTPLIISGPTDDRSDVYAKIEQIVPKLSRQVGEVEEGEEGDGDYSVDEKSRQVQLSEQGHERVEILLTDNGLLAAGESLYSASNISLMAHVNAALRAHALFKRDVDYVVTNGEIVIVDEFTGRTMAGRRWSEGLHQAVEAKEGVSIQQENQTLAAITYQNYFRLYEKLAGMTGTADTEAYEFEQIYGLEVVVAPTHRDMVREDLGDVIFLTAKEKYTAIIEDIRECIETGQPVLVGTASIDSSEYLSSLLDNEKIKHQVLNAKFHEREAHIIAQAGRPGSITVATNMAGRGTDIVLGGGLEAKLAELGDAPDAKIEALNSEWQERHDRVIESGGLHIIGTERHESRRIDNQLRGRSGRQGDAGSSRFYLSLEDNLMRIFASERVSTLMQKLGMEEGEAIEHPWVSKAIENAQRKVEGRNFDIRKQLLEFDDVANDQRKHVYEQRRELMEAEDISENIKGIRHDVVSDFIDTYIPPQSFHESWDVEGLTLALQNEYGQKCNVTQWLEDDEQLDEEGLRKRILEAIEGAYNAKEELVGPEILRQFEQQIMLQVLDSHWKDHLAAMDYLRQGIHLRGFAQKNPKQEYKREAFEMFGRMLQEIMSTVVTLLSRVEVKARDDVDAVEEQRKREAAEMEYQHRTPENAIAEQKPARAVDKTPFVRQGKKIGRNDPCPCDSGKKYKQCHGKIA